MRELYRSEQLLVRTRPVAGSARWVVTFDHYGQEPGLDRDAFGEQFLLAEGWSALHILGRGSDWYQYADLPAALAAAAAHLAGAERVVTYGSSMGGFAALRFADAVGAHAAVALSPQYSNDPRLVPWERRWREDARRIRWRPAGRAPIRTAALPVVLFDPVLDGRHAALIARDAPALLVPLPHAGHPVGTLLAELDLLRPLLRAVLDGAFEPLAYRAAVRAGRARSAAYLSGLALAQPAWRRRLAIGLGRRALALAPGNLLIEHRLGLLLSLAGDHAEAVALLAGTVAATARGNADHLDGHAQVLLAAGRPDEALAALDAAILLRPNLTHLVARRARILRRLGRRGDAFRSAARAAFAVPRHLPHWLGLARSLLPPPRG